MKKKKLILIQPQKYNELFSTYHNSNKQKKFLPKIPLNLQKDWEITAYTTRTNDQTSKVLSKKESFFFSKNSNILKRNNDYMKFLMTHQNSHDNYYKNDFLPFPSLTQQYKKIDENSKNKKKFEIKKSNFNIIYLNLSQNTNKSNQEFSVETIDKNKIVNEKIEEINRLKKQKIKDIFNKNEKSKLKNDLSKIEKIPVVLVNFFAEDLYNNLNKKENKVNNISNNNSKNISYNKNIDSKENMYYFDNINKTIYKNNTFFQYILNNVKRKIEIMNDSNKSLSILYVMNLINSELSDLKKNIEDYEKNYLIESQFTSNNISKISNYEIASSNTFRFKTNNSNINDNNSNYNNNSSILGNLIKGNIFSKRNDGSKRLKFDNLKSRENLIFQNQEIIYSINQEETKGEIKPKYIKKINIPKISKNKKNLIEIGTNTEKDKIFTSRSYYTSPNRIKSKKNFFHKINTEKKVTRSFSEIFLKNNYQKASDCINEISNIIEKQFSVKKSKENNKSKNKLNILVKNGNINPRNFKNNKIFYSKTENKVNNINNTNIIILKKDKSQDNNQDKIKVNNQGKNKDKKDDYEYIDEQNIITPKRSKEFLQAFSDNQEKSIKIKNKKMKNNYENIILNIQNIKQKEKKKNLTPKKSSVFKNKKLKTDTSSSLYDGQQSSENQEPNLIYFNRNRKSDIIYENSNTIIKGNKKHKKKKNKNKDLANVKSTKTSEKNIFKKTINNNNSNKLSINNVDNNKIIKQNKKHKSKKSKKRKEKRLILHLINNNQNIQNKDEIIKKYIINSTNEKDENFEGEEENEEEEYEEGEDEEEEEEKEIEIKENIINNNQKYEIQKDENKNLENEKKKKKKVENKEKDISEKKSSSKKLISKNVSKEKEKSSNKKIIKEIIKRNKEIGLTLNNSTNLKTKDTLINQENIESNNQIIKNNKSKTVEKNKVLDKNKNMKMNISDEGDPLYNAEYQELVKEMEKYNARSKKDLYNKKHLTLDKKDKNTGGGMHPKSKDNSFFLLEDNLDEILKKNTPPNKVNMNNYNKQEELKIFYEIMELDNLLEEERSFLLSEMLSLKNIIIKSKKIDKEVREQINLRRISSYRLVNKYFINLILDDIKNETVEKDKYSNKLKKLEKIQNFGIFTYKNLSILESKYVIPYLEEEERKMKEQQEKENKKLRERAALEEFENNKKSRKIRKSALIYDNSYLFKKEKRKEYKLRKEVEDLLNKEYNQFQQKEHIRTNHRLMSLITKRKSIEKKKKTSKKNYKNAKLKRLQMQDEDDEVEIKEKNIKDIEEQKMEELKDKKLKEFFEKIRKLKNGEFKDFDEELNQLINEIMDKKDVVSKNKENRMNSFMQNFEYNRIQNKAKDKYYNKGFNFVSPIRFISDNNK